MKDLINKILETRALSKIESLIEERLQSDRSLSEATRRFLESLLSLNNLDKISISCHEYLSVYHAEKARYLETWLTTKGNK